MNGALGKPWALFALGHRMAWGNESRHARGYGYAWVKLTKTIRKRDSNLCQPCMRQGILTQADAVDHIKPKAKGGTDEPSNLQCICNDCHDTKTEAEAMEAQGRKARPALSFDANGFPIWP